MSYSRWSNSKWYTFYVDSDSKIKQDQMFEISMVCRLTFTDINENLFYLLGKIKSLTDATNEEMNELCGYILEFYTDVMNNNELDD